MKRSGGKAGRPFGEWRIEQLEKHLKKVTSMDDLHAIRAELGHRTTKRSKELKSLVDRVIREATGSFDPNARVKREEGRIGPEEWWLV